MTRPQPALLCFGEPMQEFNQQPGSELFLRGHGGDTSNVAIAAARQGACVGYITAIGTDEPGRSFLALWAREGVDASTVKRDPAAPTAVYFVSHGAEGHHFTFHRRGSAASRYKGEDLPLTAISAARVLHLSGISQAISDAACDAGFQAIQQARQAGVAVSYDTNYRPALWPPGRAAAVMHAAIAQADFCFPSLDDATALTGLTAPDAVVDFYLRLCPLVVLKLGPAGALLATRNARQHIPAHPVQALDATGAGDTFVGAFLARHLAGAPALDAARYAAVAAALSTTGYGAVAPIPDAATVLAALPG